MVHRRKIQRKKEIVRQQPEPEDVDDVEGEEMDDEFEAEEEVVPRRVSRRVVEEEVADEEGEEDEDHDVPPPVKRKFAGGSKSKPAAKPEVETEVYDSLRTSLKSTDKLVADNIFTDLFTAMGEGQCLVVTKTAANKWQLALGDAVKLGTRKMSNAEIQNVVRDPKFLEWVDEWRKKSFEEKKKYAQKIGAKWDPHKDEQIEVIRITQAVREKEKIEKYRPEYRTRAARAALRGG